MNLKGNTIMITGGTSGIGLAFAEEFYHLGNTVIICGRRTERLEQIKQLYPEIITKVCDVSIDEEREEFCKWTLENYPDLNIVMNNAGIQLAIDLTTPVNLGRVRKEIETNLIAPIHLASLFTAHLIEKAQQNENIETAIINISSGLAFVPIAFMPVYCATKAAVHSYTLSLRHQLKESKVKVFEIAPPSTDTELGHDRRSDKEETHGGIPVSEFMTEAIEAIKNDLLEAPIGQAKGLRAKREELFLMMNH